MSRTRIYIAGPMSGYPGFNFKAFFDAAKTLKDQFYTVYNPAAEDIKAWPTLADNGETEVLTDFAKVAIRHDINLILDRVDALVMLDGWENSSGARLEFSLARFLKLPIYWMDDQGFLTPITGNLEYVQG